MGCIGMSMDDFCRCTPSEFYAIHKAWQEARDSEARSQWERTRMQCLCMLQPYSKKRLRVQDVMQLPWDALSEGRREKIGESACELSYEEIIARYREAKKRMGF